MNRPAQHETRCLRVFCCSRFRIADENVKADPVRQAFQRTVPVFPQAGRPTLADFIDLPGVYAAGRLDADSEGLLLTDDGQLQSRIADPRNKLEKMYCAQVEGKPVDAALARLEAGVAIEEFIALPCEARIIPEPPGLRPRFPPICYCAAIPTSRIELVLRDGKNRQVRPMTAQVGRPTLRLIRCAIGPWHIAGLGPGNWRHFDTGPLSDLPARR